MAIPPFGSPPTPDATATKKGKLKLTNSLGGTADLPELSHIITAGSAGSSTLIPVPTWNAEGRLTSVTTVAPIASTQRTFSFFME